MRYRRTNPAIGKPLPEFQPDKQPSVISYRLPAWKSITSTAYSLLVIHSLVEYQAHPTVVTQACPLNVLADHFKTLRRSKPTRAFPLCRNGMASRIPN